MNAKPRAAALSIGSNAALILLKVVAGRADGLGRDPDRGRPLAIDLLASFVAFFSVRKADEPADEDHRYGHAKIESLAAAIEAMLILVGSAIMVFEAVRRLVDGGSMELPGSGSRSWGSHRREPRDLRPPLRRGAGDGSDALAGDAAHLRTDAWTSLGVLVGLVLVKVTGATGSMRRGARGRGGDRRRRRAAAPALLARARRRGAARGRAGRDPRRALHFGPRGVAGYHALRTRRAGTRRYVDLHVQFRAGTTLEEAHRLAHDLQDAIALRARRRRRADPPRAGGPGAPGHGAAARARRSSG